MTDLAAAPLRLADLTTLRLGGPAAEVVEATDEAGLIRAVASADDAGTPVLLVAGGSNLVVGDAGFPGRVVLIRTSGVERLGEPDAATDPRAGQHRVIVRAAAGTGWDDFVAQCVAGGLAGIEALSGIPGSVGATPVQNVGAYGQDVAQTISSVRVWDRAARQVRDLSPDELGFAYRWSALKADLDRYLVLTVDFALSPSAESMPVAYPELAARLGVEVGGSAPLADVRDGVLGLRAGKGMVLDASDHDTWSAGSFFTNPILSAEEAAALPAEAPRFPVADSRAKGQPAAGSVKASAAWLIAQAGFSRGFAIEQAPHVSLSSKHTLALTNRGGASTSELLMLAATIRAGVERKFGIALEPEPVLVGCSLG